MNDLYFNQEPIKLKHCPAKNLNLFLLILFQHCFLKNADVLPLFLLFSRKTESNIKVKVILKWKFKPIAWLPFKGDSTMTIYPLKIYGFRPDFGLTKRRATQLKPNKICIDELSYQPEKLYAEALLYVLSKAEEINTTLKNECMACYDPVVEIHSCDMNNPREKVARSFDNAFESIDLRSANEITLKKLEIKFRWQSKTKI